MLSSFPPSYIILDDKFVSVFTSFLGLVPVGRYLSAAVASLSYGICGKYTHHSRCFFISCCMQLLENTTFPVEKCTRKGTLWKTRIRKFYRLVVPSYYLQVYCSVFPQKLSSPFTATHAFLFVPCFEVYLVKFQIFF